MVFQTGLSPGMDQHPLVLGRLPESAIMWPGSGGTRTMLAQSLHVLLNGNLTDLHCKESAMLFTSGYAVELGQAEPLPRGLHHDCIVLSECAHQAR